jgi:hypothetical protein
MYHTSLIVSPVKDLWKADFYNEPVEYYSNQAVGSLYIEVAPQIPVRYPSPFLVIARERAVDAVIRIKRAIEQKDLSTIESILPIARKELDDAQKYMERKVNRNEFLKPSED